MKRLLLICCAGFICIASFAQRKIKEGVYVVPDSIKASGIYTEVIITDHSNPHHIIAYVNIGEITLSMLLERGKKEVWFAEKKYGTGIATSTDVVQKGPAFLWPYNWQYNQKYPLLIMTANDSADKKTLYSGYIFLPEQKKWKLIGTISHDQVSTINGFTALNKQKKNHTIAFSNRWLIRNNNSWKALNSQTIKPPVLRPMSNIDSVAQQKMEEDNLNAKLSKDSVTYKEGIFYQPIKEGTGRLVNLTDTVVVHYKGWLFSNGNVFDETKEKPATFPLSRLIRGWQIGVPQCKVGGKIRLFIPSGSAYGIRTFATDIPPNSTLVFDVEVLEVKEKK